MQRHRADTVDFDARFDFGFALLWLKVANKIQFGSANRSIWIGEQIQFESKYGRSSGQIHSNVAISPSNLPRLIRPDCSEISFRIAVSIDRWRQIV